MELLLAMIVAGVLGSFVGHYVNVLVLLFLTVLGVGYGLTLPTQTLAAMISLVYWLMVGPFLICAWIAYLSAVGFGDGDWWRILLR